MRYTASHSIYSAIKRILRVVATTPLCLVAVYFVLNFCVTGCTIEPPLKLADDLPEAEVAFGEVITNIDVIWNIDGDWREQWWYGWDEQDIAAYGPIAYPEPSSYEGRFYYYGDPTPADTWLNIGRQTVYEKSFRRKFDFGHHYLLIWSNIDSPDGTQALIVDENDPGNVTATTSRSRLPFATPGSRTPEAYNNPEVFYAGSRDGIYISRDTLDYDYFDPVRNAWIKEIPATLYPMVYIYLVQVVVYNNHGRITGITDHSAVSSMAGGVNVHTGHTNNTPVTVTYPMRMKRDLPARDARRADIFGGKFTTFGLCDMEAWHRSRVSSKYSGGRADLNNHLMVNLNFKNANDSTYTFNITNQLQTQAHGGLITIEIDADTLTMPPVNTGGASGGFNPTIAPSDTVEYIFGI